MPRAPFYEIDKSAYLYPASLREDVEREQREEPVRQWCAFELMRVYGVKVSELTFEKSVKVGSKTYRVDILVTQRGEPWIVVECKERNHAKAGEGIEQAISYARAIGAEYAVYTNGTDWRVSRSVQDEWVRVIDIPDRLELHPREPITEVLRGLDAVAPLLHKLDEKLEGEDARLFLSGMQIFFVGRNILTDDVDRDLGFGTDCLLRVLSTRGAHPGYTFEKLKAARDGFEKFRQERGVGQLLPEVEGGRQFAVDLQYLHASILAIIEDSRGLSSSNLRVLRLVTALLEYGRKLYAAEAGYPPLGQNIHHALREYLGFAAAVHLNASLPDTLDNILSADMRAYCASAWSELAASEDEARNGTVGDFLGALWARLQFWKT